MEKTPIKFKMRYLIDIINVYYNYTDKFGVSITLPKIGTIETNFKYLKSKLGLNEYGTDLLLSIYDVYRQLKTG